ncbi:GNAT family N-acetyltransferase [Gulosibacter faecalis]|uniref:GNAT family N-acetyltransferase n=1 Tax=Gulosibacter faecalis TaxID=272240 RepID=A0ABW5V3D9_9MICO|nr:GNAT family N-acetyltransferase [Gulosibacter faecalis]
MQHVTVRAFDAERDAQPFAQFLTDDECALHGAASILTPDAVRVMCADTEYWRQRRWVAVRDGRVVGTAALLLPLSENLDLANVVLKVLPDAQGEGIGTRLVEECLLPAFRESGRARLEAYGEFVGDDDVDDPAHPVNRIARRLGVVRKNLAVARIAPIPVDAGAMAELQREADAASGDYRLLLWRDRVPEEYLAEYSALMRQLDLDEPDEDVVSEVADYTPERIRAAEERSDRMGERMIIAVAQAADGTLAAHSEVHVLDTPGTDLALQENTIVFEAHRGHRLGLALKLATHRRLAEDFPEVRRIVTWNSHVNPWMIHVNEQLGYEIAYREVTYQTP